MVCGGACTDITTTAHCGSCTTCAPRDRADQRPVHRRRLSSAAISGGQGGTNGGGGGGTAWPQWRHRRHDWRRRQHAPHGLRGGPRHDLRLRRGHHRHHDPARLVARAGGTRSSIPPPAADADEERHRSGRDRDADAGPEQRHLVCDKWAMHSTSSGHINYVGFGTSINQVLPAPPATATTTKTKNPYDTTDVDVRRHDLQHQVGLGNRAQRLVRDCRTRRISPSPTGRSRPRTEPRRAQLVAEQQRHRRVQHAWQADHQRHHVLAEVYVPFGLLAPALSAGVGDAAPCATAPSSVRLRVSIPQSPGLAVLGLRPVPQGRHDRGNLRPVGRRRRVLQGGATVWRPSRRRRTRPRRSRRTARSGPAPSRPAPAASSWSMCTCAGRTLRRDQRQPSRVIRPENDNDTVSEGIGYGMLIAVYMGDKRCLTDSTHTGSPTAWAVLPVR